MAAADFGKRERDGDGGKPPPPPKQPSPSMPASGAPKPVGRPRSFSDAARLSMQEADKAQAEGNGHFATGYRYEARETMRLRNSGHWNFVDAQPPLAIPGGGTSVSGTRKPDLVVTHTDGSLHMVDIKAGRDITHSVDQLKDLTNVTGLRFGSGPAQAVSSLTVVTGVGSRDVDVRSLAQVHNYSRDTSTYFENLELASQGKPLKPRAQRLPLRVRSNSMDEGSTLDFPAFMARRAERMAPPPAPASAATKPFPDVSGSGHGSGASKPFPTLE